MIQKVNRKSMIIRPSGRSTDFLTPTIIMGCGYNCSYCYCKRHKTEGIDVAKNIEQILTEVDHHVWFADVEKPNQTHPEYITYDIGCNSDMSLHLKHYDWKKIFDFFKSHSLAMGSFATKYVNDHLLEYNPEGKIRIRFSLMPQRYADELEPRTSLIEERVRAIDRFINAGYDVHVNFSPVVVTPTWLEDYKQLFNLVNDIVINKDKVKAEVIFLTHNEKKHEYNLTHNLSGESLLWKPELQESKVSQYGGDNIRYKLSLKSKYIEQFKQLHGEIIDWCTIRYIF
jgi:spore photoproduct lyase